MTTFETADTISNSLDTVYTLLLNAGFNVTWDGPVLLVGLKNRVVTIVEIKLVMGRLLDYYILKRSGPNVRIKYHPTL